MLLAQQTADSLRLLIESGQHDVICLLDVDGLADIAWLSHQSQDLVCNATRYRTDQLPIVSRAMYPGAGIGLSLFKETVERPGGQIWVESESRKGSVFFFPLPSEGVSL